MRQVIIYPGEDGFWVAECPKPSRLHQPGQEQGGGDRERQRSDRGLHRRPRRGRHPGSRRSARRHTGGGMSKLPAVSGRPNPSSHLSRPRSRSEAPPPSAPPPAPPHPFCHRLEGLRGSFAPATNYICFTTFTILP